MPRALLVPYRAELARGLLAAGHPVRAVGSGEEPGVEFVGGDPDRIITLMPALAAVTLVAWLFGDSDAPELHDGRLRMLLEKVVDTPVRGVLYEASPRFPRGRERIAYAAETWHIPVRVIDPGEDPLAPALALLGGVPS